jgi:hypothetical protein
MLWRNLFTLLARPSVTVDVDLGPDGTTAPAVSAVDPSPRRDAPDVRAVGSGFGCVLTVWRGPLDAAAFDEEPEPSSDGVSSAQAGAAIAVPIPNATASPPTRPT